MALPRAPIHCFGRSDGRPALYRALGASDCKRPIGRGRRNSETANRSTAICGWALRSILELATNLACTKGFSLAIRCAKARILHASLCATSVNVHFRPRDPFSKKRSNTKQIASHYSFWSGFGKCITDLVNRTCLHRIFSQHRRHYESEATRPSLALCSHHPLRVSTVCRGCAEPNQIPLASVTVCLPSVGRSRPQYRPR